MATPLADYLLASSLESQNATNDTDPTGLTTAESLNLTFFILSTFLFLLLALTHLFLTNRILAKITSFILNKLISSYIPNTRLRLTLDKLKLCLLGGKILFQGLRIVGSSGAIWCVRGYVTCKWWLVFRRATYSGFEGESNLHFNLVGVEIFLFDNGIEEPEAKEEEHDEEEEGEDERDGVSAVDGRAESRVEEEEKGFFQKMMEWAKMIGVRITKGHLVLGNHLLPYSFEVTFAKAMLAIVLRERRLDMYQLVVQSEIRRPSVVLIKNEAGLVRNQDPHPQTREDDVEQPLLPGERSRSGRGHGGGDHDSDDEQIEMEESVGPGPDGRDDDEFFVFLRERAHFDKTAVQKKRQKWDSEADVMNTAVKYFEEVLREGRRRRIETKSNTIISPRRRTGRKTSRLPPRFRGFQDEDDDIEEEEEEGEGEGEEGEGEDRRSKSFFDEIVRQFVEIEEKYGGRSTVDPRDEEEGEIGDDDEEEEGLRRRDFLFTECRRDKESKKDTSSQRRRRRQRRRKRRSADLHSGSDRLDSDRSGRRTSSSISDANRRSRSASGHFSLGGTFRRHGHHSRQASAYTDEEDEKTGSSYRGGGSLFDGQQDVIDAPGNRPFFGPMSDGLPPDDLLPSQESDFVLDAGHHFLESETLLDARTVEKLDVLYFRDAPGRITQENSGSCAPVHRLELTVQSYGDAEEDPRPETLPVMKYGPFTDHARALVTSFFFPTTFADAVDVTQTLTDPDKVQWRTADKFILDITFDRGVNWILPYMRSPQTLGEKARRQGKKEFLFMSAGPDSGILIEVGAGHNAVGKTRTLLELELHDFKMVSSSPFGDVFDDLIQSRHLFMDYECFTLKFVREQLGIPWNSEAAYDWQFVFRSGEVWFLMQHQQVIVDFVRTWSNYLDRRPLCVEEFIPAESNFVLGFEETEFLFHSNKYNLIDVPNDESNTVVVLHLPLMKIDFKSVAKEFNPEKYQYLGSMTAKQTPESEKKAGFSMRLPPDHPIRREMRDAHDVEVAAGRDDPDPDPEDDDFVMEQFLTGKEARMDFRYDFYSQIRKDVCDSFYVDMNIVSPHLTLRGFYLLFLFQWAKCLFFPERWPISRREFLLNGNKNDKSREVSFLNYTDDRGHRIASNPMETTFNINLHYGGMDIPTYLYRTEDQDKLTVTCSSLVFEIHLSPHFLEVSIDSSPFLCTFGSYVDEPFSDSSESPPSRFVGLDRLKSWMFCAFGPWPDFDWYHGIFRFDLGDIRGEMTTKDLRVLMQVLPLLIHQIGLAYEPTDLDNLKPDFSYCANLPEDVRRLRLMELIVAISSISFLIDVENDDGSRRESAPKLLARVPEGLTIMYDSTITEERNKQWTVTVPRMELEILAAEGYLRPRQPCWSVGHIRTGLKLWIPTRLATARGDCEEQRRFVGEQTCGIVTARAEALAAIVSPSSPLDVIVEVKASPEDEPSSAGRPLPKIQVESDPTTLENALDELVDAVDEGPTLTDITDDDYTADEYGDARDAWSDPGEGGGGPSDDDDDDEEEEEGEVFGHATTLSNLHPAHARSLLGPKIYEESGGMLKPMTPAVGQNFILGREKKQRQMDSTDLDYDFEPMFFGNEEEMYDGHQGYRNFLQRLLLVRENGHGRLGRFFMTPLHSAAHSDPWWLGMSGLFPVISLKPIPHPIHEPAPVQCPQSEFFRKLSKSDDHGIIPEVFDRTDFFTVDLLGGVDLGFSPKALDILRLFVEHMLDLPTVDLWHVMDDLELSSAKLPETFSDAETEDPSPEPEDSKSNKKVVSFYVSTVDVRLTQALHVPVTVVNKSPLFGMVSTYALTLHAENIHTLFSVSLFPESHQRDSPTFAFSLQVTSLNSEIRCLSKKGDELGIPNPQREDSDDERDKPGHPKVLSLAVYSLQVQSTGSRDQRKNLSCGVSVENNVVDLKSIQEIPAIIFAGVQVWEAPIMTLIRRLRFELPSLRRGRRLRLVEIVSSKERLLDKTAHDISQHYLDAESDFVLVGYPQDNPADAMYGAVLGKKRALKVVKNIVVRFFDRPLRQELEYQLRRMTNADGDTLKVIRRGVASALLSLFPQPPTESVSGEVAKRMRVKIRCSLPEISLGVHSHGLGFTSTARFGGISIDCCLDSLKSNREQRRLAIVASRRGIAPLDIVVVLTLSVKLKSLHVNVYPVFASFLTCAMGVIVNVWEDRKKWAEEPAVSSTIRLARGDLNPSRTKFYMFGNVLLERVDGRAWMDDETFTADSRSGYLKLDVDNLSLVFNQPKVREDRLASMVHCANLSVDKARLRLHFHSRDADFGPRKEDRFMDLFLISLDGASLVYMKGGDETSTQSRIFVAFLFNAFTVTLRGGLAWIDALFEGKDFFQKWFNKLKDSWQSMSKRLVSGEPEDPAPVVVDAPRDRAKRPLFDVHLHFRKMRFKAKVSEAISVFKRDYYVEFPSLTLLLQEENLTRTQFLLEVDHSNMVSRLPRNSRGAQRDSSRRQFLPTIFCVGQFERPIDQQKKFEIRLSVERLQNEFSPEDIDDILTLRSALLQEISNVLDRIKAKNLGDIKQAISNMKPESLAPRRASVGGKEMPAIEFCFRVESQGFHLSMMSGRRLELALNSDAISVDCDGIGLGTQNVKLRGRTHGLGFALKDTELHMREGPCQFVWGDFTTDVELKYDRSKWRVDVNQTRSRILPGFAEQLYMLYGDYEGTAVTLKTIFQSNELGDVREQYAEGAQAVREYVQKENLSRHFVFTHRLVVSIVDTVFTIPLGSNPYYSVIRNVRSSFIPKAFAHLVIEKVVSKGTIAVNDAVLKVTGKVVVKGDRGAYLIFKDNKARRGLQHRGLLNIASIRRQFRLANRFVCPRIALRFDFRVDLKTRADQTKKEIVLRACANCQSPKGEIDAEFIRYILFLRDDFTPTPVLRSKMSLLNPKATGIVPSVHSSPPPRNSAIGDISLQCRLDVDEGHFGIFHGEKRREVFSTRLPRVQAGVLYRFPTPRRSRSIANLHAEVFLSWAGAERIQRDVMLFVKEVVSVVAEHRRFLQSRNSANLGANEEEEVDVVVGRILPAHAELDDDADSSSAPILPLAWIRSVRAAIRIQSWWRGVRLRQLFKKALPYHFDDTLRVALEEESGSRFRSRLEKHLRHEEARFKAKSQMGIFRPPAPLNSRNVFSFLVTIQPFGVGFVSPERDISMMIRVPHPIHVCYTQAQRSCLFGAKSLQNVFDLFYFIIPEVSLLIRGSFQVASLSVNQIKGNLGSATGELRHDKPTYAGTIMIEEIRGDFDVSHLDDLVRMYALWKTRFEDAGSSRKEVAVSAGFLPETRDPIVMTPKARVGDLAGVFDDGSGMASDNLDGEMSEMSTTSQTSTATTTGELMFVPSSSVFVDIHVNEVKINTLPENLVDLEVRNGWLAIANRGRFSRTRLRDPFYLELCLEGVGVRDGTQTLDVGVNNVGFSLFRHFEKVGFSEVDQTPYAGELSLAIPVVSFQMKQGYYQETAVFDLKNTQVLSRSHRSSKRIATKISFGSCSLTITPDTLPNLVDLAESHIGIAREKFEEARSSLVREAESFDEQREITKVLQGIRSHIRDSAPLGEISVQSGTCTLNLRQGMRVADRSFFSIDLRSAGLGFHLREDEGQRSRGIELQLMEFLLQKKIDDSPLPQGRLFGVPFVRIVMMAFQELTKQGEDSKVLTYLSSAFNDTPVNVSLDINLYRFFLDLIRSYVDATKKKMATDDDARESPSAMALKVVTPPPRSDPSDLEFEIGSFQLNPTLRALGDATPSVGRVMGLLGVKEEMIPKALYTLLALQLEKVLTQLTSLERILEKRFQEKK